MKKREVCRRYLQTEKNNVSYTKINANGAITGVLPAITQRRKGKMIKSFDGKEIFTREWADVENPRAVVQISHGMNEYSGRYEDFAKRLNEKGYIVVASDHRGHGETDKDSLGFSEGDMFDNSVKDLAVVTDYFKEKYSGLPYVLFGFSYGSFLTQRYLQLFGDKLDGAILGGSSKNDWMLAETGYVCAKIAAAFKGKNAPAKFVNKNIFGSYDKKMPYGEFLSVDEENNAKYHADKYCEFVCSNNFFISFMKNMKKLYSAKRAAGLKKYLPLLIISGADDAVGNMSKGTTALYEFYIKNGVKDVTLHFIEGSRHEFLNEKVNREEGISVITEFLDRATKNAD